MLLDETSYYNDIIKSVYQIYTEKNLLQDIINNLTRENINLKKTVERLYGLSSTQAKIILTQRIEHE